MVNRKLDQRLELIRSATTKSGGVYLYANQRGCDGNRLYYDGCASVAMNGALLVQVGAAWCFGASTTAQIPSVSTQLNRIACSDSKFPLFAACNSGLEPL